MISLNKRLISLFIIICLFLVVLFRFFYLQVIYGDYYSDQAINKIVRGVPIIAKRGSIIDRTGKTIVKDDEVYDLQLSAPDVNDNFNYERLLELISFDTTKIKNKIYKNRYSFRTLSLKNKIPKDIIFKIEEEREKFPGLLIRKLPIRQYSYNSNKTLAFILGETKIKRKTFFDPIYDEIGLDPRAGQELYYDNILKGIDGKQYYYFNKSGMNEGDYDGEFYGNRKPISGHNLEITIDLELQNFIYKEMKDYDGVIICSIPETGEILSFFSNPFIDIDKLSKGISYNELDSLIENLNSPFLNRGISSYAPGSIMKLPVAMMLIEEGFNENTNYDCNGKYIFPNSNKTITISSEGDSIITLESKACHTNHNQNINLKEAISESCNAYFYQSVDLDYYKIYKRKWYDWMVRFGFGKLTGIDLLYEKNSNFIKPSSKSKMLNMVIGQEMLVTPIQVIQMINIIANDGILVKPHFNKNLQPEGINLDLNKNTINFIQDAMESVVISGTGANSRVEDSNIIIRAKTGTAQLKRKTQEEEDEKNSHAWYAGYMEYNGNQKVSIVIMLERGGSGGAAPSLMARNIFNKIININKQRLNEEN